MAKPRIFISSTYYDLKHVRRTVEAFVEQLGYEAAIFESGDIPFAHDVSLDESCYREIGLCHLLVLIIGGRYGAPTSDTVEPLSEDELDRRFEYYNSITRKEYETAREADIPIYIFVERQVAAELETFKKNRGAKVQYAHVDSVNVFLLLEDIYAQRRNNLVREFSNIEEITTWLRDQWAGLFAHFLSRHREERTARQLSNQMASLEATVNALKEYSEVIVRSVERKEPEKVIQKIDGDLKERERLNRFASIDWIGHLTAHHKVPIDLVEQAFRKAKTLEEFDALITALKPPDTSCPGFRPLRIFPQIHRELQEARLLLGLEPFDNVKPNKAKGKVNRRRTISTVGMPIGGEPT